MKTKLIAILIMLIVLAGLTAGAALRAIDYVKYVYPVVITHRTTGYILDYDPFNEVWFVENPAGAVVFEGGERDAVGVFLCACP